MEKTRVRAGSSAGWSIRGQSSGDGGISRPNQGGENVHNVNSKTCLVGRSFRSVESGVWPERQQRKRKRKRKEIEGLVSATDK